MSRAASRARSGSLAPLARSAPNDEQKPGLSHGRTLEVSSDGQQDVLELRSSDGSLELRLELTESGVLLRATGIHISVDAAESIDLRSKHVTIAASEALKIESQGELEISAEQEMAIRSEDDVRVRGAKIYLN